MPFGKAVRSPADERLGGGLPGAIPVVRASRAGFSRQLASPQQGDILEAAMHGKVSRVPPPVPEGAVPYLGNGGRLDHQLR